MDFQKETLEQQENHQRNEDAENVLPAPTSTKEAVCRVFVDTRKPMKAAEVCDIVASSTIPSDQKQALLKDKGSETRRLIRELANDYENVLKGEPYQPYIIHPDWNGKPFGRAKEGQSESHQAAKARQASQFGIALVVWPKP